MAALLAGLVVVVLQFPWSGVDTDPPTCYGMFQAWTVPCGGWPTVLAGAVTTVLVWVVLLVKGEPEVDLIGPPVRVFVRAIADCQPIYH